MLSQKIVSIRTAVSVKVALLVFALSVIVGMSSTAHADVLIAGFNGGVDWTTNTNDVGPIFSGDTLQLTSQRYFQATSAWFKAPIDIASDFSAQFTYVASGSGPLADGTAFVFQTSGLSALGAAGGGLGFGGSAPIVPSVALALNLYSLYPPQGPPGTNLYFDGLDAQTAALQGNPKPYQSTSPVDLTSGNPIEVTLRYEIATSTLTVSLRDLSTLDTFNTSYIVDLAASLGSPTAYVGFTGGTGACTANQTVSNFRLVPEPSTVALLGIGTVGLLAYGWRRRRR